MHNDDLLIAYSNILRRKASLQVDLLAPEQKFMEDILLEAKQVLSVSYISIWILKEIGADTIIECVAHTEWANGNSPDVFPTLNKNDFGNYFSAIEFGESIVAHDAETDERTAEFLEPYLKPQNIKAMLDTIIFQDGFPSGVICCEQVGQTRKWRKEEIHFAEVISDCCTYRFMAKKQALLEVELEKLAFVDELTQAFNRRFFFESIDSMHAFHKRNDYPLTIALIDLDDFKKINDTHGHDVGDKVLKKLVLAVKSQLRKEDLFCRFGGEEFIVAFQCLNASQAKDVLKRVLQSAIDNPVQLDDKEIEYSFSAGVCQVNFDDNISKSIKTADTALYKVKETGKRNIAIGK
ncbi:MAG: sensor domain-containing diguanylate cyclase [Gammaproteobacteria bacterium]|nr:sensor domain-containing diguanylate cyclase [Gammaproteobacteria bacterium]